MYYTTSCILLHTGLLECEAVQFSTLSWYRRSDKYSTSPPPPPSTWGQNEISQPDYADIIFLQDAGTYLPDYTVSHPKRPYIQANTTFGLPRNF